MTTHANAAAVVKLLRSKHVVTERDEMIDKLLLKLFEKDPEGNATHVPVLFTAGTETKGITLIEGSGGGKTTALFRVLREFAPLSVNPETGAPRWLHVKVESPATQRSLGVSILRKLGVDRVSERTKVYEVWDLVRHRFGVMGISLLWIDEAHDMFGAPTSTETKSIFKTLKSLMQGENPVVLVLSGTERLAELTRLDHEVKRRFFGITPGGLSFERDAERMRSLVEGYASLADITVSLGDDAINRLIHAGCYRFGRCIEISIDAIECAILDGANALVLRHFEDAFAQREGVSLDANVFSAADWRSIQVLGEEEPDTMATQRVSRKGSRR
jgi:hypothetical protein